MLDFTILLRIFAVVLMALTAYSLGHYLCLFSFILARPRKRIFFESPRDSVAVLIPARNEGRRAVQAIHSILDQDYQGDVEIYLLLKDDADSSVPFLEKAFPGAPIKIKDKTQIEIFHSPHGKANRKVIVDFSGDDSKSHKINRVAGKLSTRYTGILDCDHQARKEWIRSSVALLKEKEARIIQGRRGPISALGFFQLWDSLHQHVGCELFNISFANLNLTTFVTGTTFIMDTELIQSFPLSDSITEDIDFSYNILVNDGVKVISNPYSGSDEEVSPDLYSFVARRRRWANGHTDAFISRLGSIWSAPIRTIDRLQFLFHGSHYLLALVVFLLHLFIGLLLLKNTAFVVTLAAVTTALIPSIKIVWNQRTRGHFHNLLEVLVLLLWFFPAAIILIKLTLAMLMGDPGIAALPVSKTLQMVGLIGFAAPLVILLVGLAGLGQWSKGTFLAVLFTYPVAFYLDIGAVLLGLVDYITGRRIWRVVTRTGDQSTTKESRDASGQNAPRSLKESWRVDLILQAFRREWKGVWTFMFQPRRIIIASAVLAIFWGGVYYAWSSRIKVETANCQVLEHDTDPWIVPAAKMNDYCDRAENYKNPLWARRSGFYGNQKSDNLNPLNMAYWDKLDDTFFCNEATFRPENIEPAGRRGVILHLKENGHGIKRFTAASIATKKSDDAMFLYGRFEAILKPAKASGVITSFFLYRFDPWQEIDVEFLGRDTRKILLNVFYNPGEKGDLYNYGLKGTPVLIELGFDASEKFHKYSLEWDPEEIRWFVDGRLIHRRRSGQPTPIPHLPMRLHVNVWPTCSRVLAGPLRSSDFPTSAAIQSVSTTPWTPPVMTRIAHLLDDLSRPSDRPVDWRETAKWIQPSRR